jgi:molecular chaperone HtpG
MAEGQESIYYVTGESRGAAERSPQMEMFRERGVEVLFFLDKIDEFLTQNLREYDGKRLQSVSKGELNLAGAEETKESEEKSEEKVESLDHLLDFMRKALAEKVKDVRVSKRLKTSPVCLVSGDTGYSLNMERLYREANQSFFKATRILEINPEHEAIRTMARLLGSDQSEDTLNDYSQLLYNQALLMENDKIEDPVRLTGLISELIVRAHS